MKKYEELIDELKEIVYQIEDEKTSLEESIDLYERGTTLIKLCEKRLTEAELRISQLSADDTEQNGTLVSE
ncbi:MAG: exodeoxyribonuclease VII small subunit [Methanospirillaceae archaeon]|nr:exodeoxyribonuclease VII small subunit [Methanospirillaceae archaeon]